MNVVSKRTSLSSKWRFRPFHVTTTLTFSMIPVLLLIALLDFNRINVDAFQSKLETNSIITPRNHKHKHINRNKDYRSVISSPYRRRQQPELRMAAKSRYYQTNNDASHKRHESENQDIKLYQRMEQTDNDTSENTMTTLLTSYLPPPPEDTFLLCSDILVLALYAATSHSLNNVLVQHTFQTSTSTLQAFQTLHVDPLPIPVWINPTQTHITEHVQTVQACDTLLNHWSPLLSTPGTAGVALCTSWLVAGWVHQTYRLQYTQRSNPTTTLLKTVETWMTHAILLILCITVCNDLVLHHFPLEWQESLGLSRTAVTAVTNTATATATATPVSTGSISPTMILPSIDGSSTASTFASGTNLPSGVLSTSSTASYLPHLNDGDISLPFSSNILSSGGTGTGGTGTGSITTGNTLTPPSTPTALAAAVTAVAAWSGFTKADVMLLIDSMTVLMLWRFLLYCILNQHSSSS